MTQPKPAIVKVDMRDIASALIAYAHHIEGDGTLLYSAILDANGRRETLENILTWTGAIYDVAKMAIRALDAKAKADEPEASP